MAPVRSACSADSKRIAEIEGEQERSAHWGSAGIENEIKNPASIVLVYEDLESGMITGFIAARAAAGEAEILNLAVSKDSLRRGAAGGLLEALISSLSADGVDSITLEVGENNTPAVNLYKKYSFKTVNIRKKFYTGGEDALLMRREGESK
ncbi:ribosomal-protein-alanine N-acetyltransferase [Parelusimicrobium proximum]|uniref:GNAT family N-acetyltransferase n=1 Tax=Parelusimicrobium proximum TaxID=3228953 RepID=UPI003D16C8B8